MSSVASAQGDVGAGEHPFRRAVLEFLAENDAISEQLRSKLLGWRYRGFSAHNQVRVGEQDAEGRKKLAGYMLRAPICAATSPIATSTSFALE